MTVAARLGSRPATADQRPMAVAQCWTSGVKMRERAPADRAASWTRLRRRPPGRACGMQASGADRDHQHDERGKDVRRAATRGGETGLVVAGSEAVCVRVGH